MKLQMDAEALADFLAAVLGPDAEVAVHDLSDLHASLKVLRNGHVSGRAVGAPITDLALRMAQECTASGRTSPRYNYRSKTHNGVLLRSSTMVLCDEGGRPTAMLCVNFDDSRLYGALDAIRRLLPAEAVPLTSQESLSLSVDSLGQDILQAVLDRCPATPERLSVEEKTDVLRELDRRGLFSIRGFVGRTAQVLGISEPTLYRYLKQAGHHRVEERAS